MTELQARAEVVGYPEPVLQAIRELVDEVDANPAMAAFSAQMMAGISAGLLADDNLASGFLRAIAHLLTTAAEVALSKESI